MQELTIAKMNIEGVLARYCGFGKSCFAILSRILNSRFYLKLGQEADIYMKYNWTGRSILIHQFLSAHHSDTLSNFSRIMIKSQSVV